jgi:predicted DNA-binding transcriptional regulator YafY
MESRRMRRLVLLVDEMKRGRFPNTESFARRLRQLDFQHDEPLTVSGKTVQRDIVYLKEHFKAPVQYDPREQGYYLDDKSWSLPYLSLAEDELFAALFSKQVSEPFLPTPIQQALDEVKSIELAAGEPGDLNLDVLESLVVATGGTVPLTPEIARPVLQAWKEARTLRVTYVRADEEATERDIDIHAIFLSAGAWYARAYCHLRNTLRSFALHRIQSAELQAAGFKRSPEIVAEVRQGRMFDYAFIHNVRVRCSQDRARYFRERVWFPGQTIRERRDGSLEACYPSVPSPLFEQWVMSFMGAVTVLSPAALRSRIRRSAAILAKNHRTGRV